MCFTPKNVWRWHIGWRVPTESSRVRIGVRLKVEIDEPTEEEEERASVRMRLLL